MNEQQQTLDTLKDIRSMMERSSRFISLSGWSGVAAGVCALVGAWVANSYLALRAFRPSDSDYTRSRVDDAITGYPHGNSLFVTSLLSEPLFHIAIVTFISALVTALFFTWLKSKKQGLKMWDASSKRLMINVTIPMIAGGLFVLKLVDTGAYNLVAPACLLFYGLALLNASKYTLIEIRYLGIAQILLGLIDCWVEGDGLLFWALGFGVLHIIYGFIMWWRYERTAA